MNFSAEVGEGTEEEYTEDVCGIVATSFDVLSDAECFKPVDTQAEELFQRRAKTLVNHQDQEINAIKMGEKVDSLKKNIANTKQRTMQMITTAMHALRKMDPEKREEYLKRMKDIREETEEFLVPTGGSMIEPEGVTFKGKRAFKGSITKERDEDIVLLKAWDDIMPMSALAGIDDKLSGDKKTWEKPLLPPGKEKDDSVALFEFGRPDATKENPVTISGYCPVEVEDPREYLTFTQIERRPKDMPFQGCEWSLQPSKPKGTERTRASVRIVF